MNSSWARRIVRAACVAMWAASGIAGEARTPGQSPSAVVRVQVVVTPPQTTTGAVVTVEAEGATQRARQVTIGPSDVAWFTALDPGAYVVDVRLATGEIARGVIEVRARDVVSVEARPANGAGAAPGVVVRYRDGEAADFDERLLADLPASDVWNLAETAAPFPVVDRMDTGGLGTGTSGLVGSRGESWALTSLIIGDTTVRHPNLTGRLPAAVDLIGLSGVSVASGLAPIEVASPGVQVMALPRRAGDRWAGSALGLFTSAGMVGENATADAPSIARIIAASEAAFFAGGPIADRTSVTFSASGTRATSESRGVELSEASLARTLFARAVSVTDRTQLTLQTGLQRLRAPFDDRRQFLDPDVMEDGAHEQLQLGYDRLTATGARLSLSGGMQHASFVPEVAVDRPGGVVDRVRDGGVPAPPRETSRLAWNVRASVDSRSVRMVGVDHVWRAGLTVDRTRSSSSILALPVVAEAVNGLAARVWIPRAPAVSSQQRFVETGMYAADRIWLRSNATLDLGARADVLRASAAGAARGVAFTTVSPRAALRWAPGPLTVFAGYGKYAAVNPLVLLPFGDPGETRSEVYRWADTDGDGRFSPNEAGVLVAQSGRHASIASIDDALTASTTSEWTVGTEVRMGRHSTMRGAIVIRRQHDLFGSVNVGVPLSSYRAFTIPDIGSDEGSAHDDQALTVYERLPASFGQDAFELTNPAGAGVSYDGIELGYEFRSPRWFVIFGATAYRAVGLGGNRGAGPLDNDPLVIGERYENPNTSTRDVGRLFGDRAYVGKWSAGYRASGDVRLAAVVRYQDGQPFTRFVVLPDLAAGPEAVEAYPYGKTRFTFTGTIDLRMEKGFAFSGTRRAAIWVDLFNVSNLANEVEEDVVTGPAFRRSTALQPPRTVRLGVRVDF